MKPDVLSLVSGTRNASYQPKVTGVVKIRVYELAQSLGRSSAEVIDLLEREEGVRLGGPLNSVDAAMAARLTATLRAPVAPGAESDRYDTPQVSERVPQQLSLRIDDSEADPAASGAEVSGPLAAAFESSPDGPLAGRSGRRRLGARVLSVLAFRTIDRYVAREILSPFLLGLLVFTFVLEIPPLMEVAEKLIAKGVPSGDIVRIMITLLPQALGVTIPMALLLGTLIGLSRLSSDREAVALQACGVSIFRLLKPVGTMAVLACGATAYVMIVALPDANQTFREITYNIIATRAEHEVKPRVFFEDFPNMVLYVRDVPTDGAGWRGVFMADVQQNDPDIYVADRGRMFLDREAGRVEMTLLDGVRHRVSAGAAQEYEVLEFERMTLSLDPDTVFPRGGPQRGNPERTIEELWAEVDRLERAGFSPHPPIMTIHRKFSIPVACLVFALIGLALGVTSRRDGKLASFVLGVGVIFAYYVIMYIGEAMTKGHLVSPHLAMWLPNIGLGLLGVAILLWRAKSSELRISTRLAFLRAARPAAATVADACVPGSEPAPTTPRTARSPAPAAGKPRLQMPRPNILDWYVAKLYLQIVGLAFVAMLGIFYIATFIDLSDKLFKGQTTGWVLLTYFWYATPQYIYYVLPISALVATLVAIGLLTKSSELVVMKACGISLYRVAMPVLLFGVVWSGCLFALEESVMAKANGRAEAIRHEIRSGTPKTLDILNRRWLVGGNGSIYNYAFFDRERNELNRMFLYELDDEVWRLNQRTFATRASFDGTWQAHQGWTRRFDEDAAESYEAFETRDLEMEAPEYFASERPDAERMTYRELKTYIENLQTSGFNVVPYMVELQRKLSFPLVTIVMTLIAVPFAVTTGKRGAMYGVGLGLTLAISYWIVISIFGAIGSAGLLAPTLAAWAPNIAFGTGAVYLLLSVRT